MTRIRVTQILPFLLPLRKKQKYLFFDIAQKLDKNTYAKKRIQQLYEHKYFQTYSVLYNYDTGFDMVYQSNKVNNLKIVAKKLNKLIIKPNETFSFWTAIKDVNSNDEYLDGLVMKDGKLTICKGGGICQISNLLYWMFLHTPMNIVERKGHATKDFYDPFDDGIKGVDATVAKGWIDLKVKNNTDDTYQINFDFDDENIIGQIYCDKKLNISYKIINENCIYYSKNNNIYQSVDVIKKMMKGNDAMSKELLYTNICNIKYELASDIKVEKRG